MDSPIGVQIVPVSPGTPTNTILDGSSCSAGGYGTPGSARSTTRKVARTPSKQREETEPFDSLLESFIQGLQDVDERGVKTLILTSTALHNDESRIMQHINSPIKLEELLSDNEMEGKEGNKKSSSKEEHHLLQLTSEHYSQSLRRKGVKGLVYNVVEQRRLRQRAEHHFHKRVTIKYFTKMKVVFNERKKRRRLAIRRAQLREQTTRATQFHLKRLLERSTLRWRAWYLYRRERRAHACKLLAKANMRITFHLWQKIIQHKQELMRAFQAWRQYIYNNSLKKLSVACYQQKQTVLLQECFNKWLLKTAIIAGEGLLSSKLHEVWQQSVCHRALRGWLLNTQEARAYRGVLRHSFNRWRIEAIWLKQQKLADRYCERRRLKMAMAAWKAEYRKSLDLRVFQEKQAFVRKLKCLTLWRLATERSHTLKKEQHAYVLLRRCLLRKFFSRWKRLNENARTLMGIAQKVEHIVHSQLISDTFNTWKRQLNCRRILRHHLLDSESQLINRCFSSWRKLTTSTHSSTLESSPLNSEEYGSINPALARDDSNNNIIEISSPKLCMGYTAGQCSDDRLGYLRDLSNRIQESLQVSNHSSKGTTTPSVKRTKSVVRKLFVENEPLPNSGSSSVCDSSSQSISVQLCSCLNPQVAREVHEFQTRVAHFSSSVNRTIHDRYDTHKGEIENTARLDTVSPSVSVHCFARNPQYNDCITHNTLPMNLDSKMSSHCLKTAFHSWLALTRKKLSLRQRSAYLVKLFRLRRLKRNFEQWKEVYTKTTQWKIHLQHTNEENAKVCRTVVLSSTFNLWIHKQRNKQLLRKALSQWMLVVKVTRQEMQAEMLRRYWCLSRAWLKWRQEHIKETTSMAAVQHHNHFLLLKVFTAWQSWTERL